MDRIFQMILNRLLGRLINKGITTGINHFANRGTPDSQMTLAEREQARDARQTSKRARQAANLARRLGR